MDPEMVSTGSVSSSSTAHRCSPLSSATASDELGVVHTNLPVTTCGVLSHSSVIWRLALISANTKAESYVSFACRPYSPAVR